MCTLAKPARSITPDRTLLQLHDCKSKSALGPPYDFLKRQSSIPLKTSYANSFPSLPICSEKPLGSRQAHCFALGEHQSHELGISHQALEQTSRTQSDLPILICDGEPMETVPASAAAFLLLFPSSPYTTTRTWGHRCRLLFWESHLRRLSQSAQEMQRAGKWGPAEVDTHSAKLCIAIKRSLKVALQQTISHEAATELSVTILLLLTSDESKKRFLKGTRIARNSLKAKADEFIAEDIHSRANNEHMMDELGRASQDESIQGELQVSLAEQKLDGADCERGVSVGVYISSYEAPEGGQMPTAIAAAVMGPGRQLPLAKDSSWALERRPLEAAKPPGVSEVLLSNDGEALLEGMLTNFFVLRSCGESKNKALEKGVEGTSNAFISGEASKAESSMTSIPHTKNGGVVQSKGVANDSVARASSGLQGRGAKVVASKPTSGRSEEAMKERSLKGLVLQTASLEDGVLPGVVRQEVLRLCEEWGVSTILRAPKLSERSDWVEAFVTSSVRIVQPVSSIRWRPTWRPADADQRHVAHGDWLEHFLPNEHPFSRALWDALLDEERVGLSSLDIASFL